MAINKESNGYIILFSTIMVVVVGIGLAAVYLYTKPFQDNNAKMEKMQDILKSVNIQVARDSSEAVYNKYITESFAINTQGEVVEKDKDKVFNLDLAKEIKKPEAEQMLPIYVCTKESSKYYIIPMRGKGLWDAVWGFVSIEGDMKTVYGATFGHKSETPGLGAEIAEKPFQNSFVGKKILDEKGEFMSVSVIKKGTVPPSDYNVDGISGGTLTSNGVNDMLRVFLNAFHQYALKNAAPVAPETVMPTDSLATDSTAIAADSLKKDSIK
jgi:Na+-transporting NADH:ubiquinone oxidoreductase subunit C